MARPQASPWKKKEGEEDDLEDSFADGVAESETEGESGQAAAGAPQPARRPRDDGRRGGRGGRNDGRRGRQGGTPPETPRPVDLPIISELLKQGQEILVQIAKEPIAKKGAPYHQPHRAPPVASWLFIAHGQPRRCIAQNLFRRRAPAPETNSDQRKGNGDGRLHRPHSRRWCERRKTCAPISAS